MVCDRGGLIFEHTAAEEFSAAPLSVTANGCAIRTKLALYTSYVVAARVAKGRVPDALLWDTADPYHHLRIELHRDFDVVIFGGEDHKTVQARRTNDCYDRLERALASVAGGAEVTHRWSGHVIETPDGLPYIGETAAHQIAGTGYSGNGMTFGTLAAVMASARVLGRRSAWSDLFHPGRVKLTAAAWDYARENADYPYHMIRDRVARMTGKHETGPVCTHMGCVTLWNDAERTWDCPCHGSRFKPDGTAISGQAESPAETK